MKVAYFGGDWFLSCINAWQSANHEITHIFTHGEKHYNQQLRQWAIQQGVEVVTTKPGPSDLQKLLNEGVDCLFSIEYPWRIPCEHLPFKTINVHPSLLPEGKGPTPISWILHSYPDAAGVTFHQLSEHFDSGKIILQETLSLSPHESIDTVLARLELVIPRMLVALLADFDSLYSNATTQSSGESWPRMTLAERTINWSMTCEEIRRIVRSSGHFGAAANISECQYLIKHVQCVEHDHPLKPGLIYKDDAQHFFITSQDGICVIDKSAIIEKSAAKITD